MTCSTGTGTAAFRSGFASRSAIAILGDSSTAKRTSDRRVTSPESREQPALAAARHAPERPAKGIPADVRDALLQRNDGVVRDVNVLGTKFLTAFRDVAVLHAGISV